jgi:hypothetical protein
MDASVFRVRVAPLLLDFSDWDRSRGKYRATLRALRCVSRRWQWVVDQLADVKGAFGLRRADRLTIPDVRYAHTVKFHVDAQSALLACAGGELADLRWALAKFGAPWASGGGVDTDGDSWIMRALRKVSARTDCLELMIRSYGLPATHALIASCCDGSLAVAQWLVSTYALTAADARCCYNAALRLSCKNGHLAVAQWLASIFCLTATDARSENNYALRLSCKNGHLAVSQWLASTFCLTAADARSEDNYALRLSCENGHLTVAQWLFSTFSLTADARSESTDALHRSYERKHFAVVEWLTSTFGLTFRDMPRYWRVVENDFYCSCKEGDRTHAQWLVSAFKLTAECLRHEIPEVFGSFFERGDIAGMQWLRDTFSKPDLSAVRGSIESGFPSLCARNLSVAQWLTSTFKLADRGALKRKTIQDALWLACENERLEAAQWLHSAFSLTVKDVRRGDSHLLWASCENGRLTVAQWLVGAFEFRFTPKTVRSHGNRVLRANCANGHLAMAQWLTTTFKLTVDDARFYNNSALRLSCENGHLGVAQWLVSTFGLTADDACTVLCMSCAHGHLAAAQWLVSTFGLTVEDIRREGNRALHLACQENHPDIIQWLISTFGLSAHDMGAENMKREFVRRWNGNNLASEDPWWIDAFKVFSADLRGEIVSVFESSCMGGDLAAIQLLSSTFELPPRETIQAGLGLSCRRGHLSIAHWLVSTFGLTLDDVRKSHALCESCFGGYLHVAQWLTSNFHLGAEDARRKGNDALLDACGRGHLAVAQWLVSTFGLKDDARNGEVFLKSCVNGHLAVAQWLASSFSITVNDVIGGWNCTLLQCLTAGRVDVAEWLVNRFSVSTDKLRTICHGKERFPDHARRWVDHHLR